MKDENKKIVRRIRIIYFGVLIFALVIIYKVINIQFVEGDMWRKRAENLTLRYESVEATRGNIISSDSNLLATSVPIFDIRIDLHKSVIQSDTFKFYLNALADSLSVIFPDKSKEEFKYLLLNGRKNEDRNLLLQRNIDYSQLKRVRNFPILKKGKNKGGIIIEEKDYRKMPFKELASRTIGYENISENIRVGLEGAYSKELQGISGKRLVRKIAYGIWRPVERENQIEPENGKDIVTTIDINIQDVAENALMKCLDSNEAEHGCVVLMEVNTGYIKAIANLRRHKDGSYGEDINYAIWESAEPGSTFKLASLIAVLEENKYDTNVMVNTGKSEYADQIMEDAHQKDYGKVSLSKAFEISSNVGISEIVNRTFKNKPQKYIDYLNDMLLNKPLGLDIKGEGLPFIKNVKNPTWSPTSLAWMSIGYELQVTPLQTLTLYNAIANNGKMVKPLFVKEILQTGKLIEKKNTVVINKSICSKKTLTKVQTILEAAVGGTAKELLNTVYKIAGKTGTAKIGYGKDKDSKVYRASFVGYFPAENPKYSCIVIVTNPTKGEYYGGAIAAPVFKEIADKVYATQPDIHQEAKSYNNKIAIPYVTAGNQQELFTIYSTLNLPFRSNNPDAQYIASVNNNNLISYSPRNYKNKLVPNVYGMGAKEATYLLEKFGLKVKVAGKGKVMNQSIQAGNQIISGQLISLTLGNSSNDFNNMLTANTTVSKKLDSIPNNQPIKAEKPKEITKEKSKEKIKEKEKPKEKAKENKVTPKAKTKDEPKKDKKTETNSKKKEETKKTDQNKKTEKKTTKNK